jgi:hypothetical protein
MSTIALEPALAPKRPGFFATLWALLLAFLAAAVSLTAVALVAMIAAVVGRVTETHPRVGAIDWPFAHAGAWSVAANAVVTAGALGICALWARSLVARLADDHVSLARVWAILVVTGYAPFIAYRGLVPLHFVLGLLATTFLVRRYAIGVAPARVSRRAVAAASTLAALVPLSYGLTHPLWYESDVGGGAAPDYATHRIVFRPRHARTVAVAFTLRNWGRAHVTLLGVSGGDTPLLRVAGARAGFLEPAPFASTVPLAGRRAAGGTDLDVTIFLRLAGCDTSSGTATLDRVTVRYRYLGLTLSQPLLLAMRPTLVCR